MLDRFLFDDFAHLGDILAGSRRRVARTQERYGAEECDQGEGWYHGSFGHGLTSGLSFGSVTEGARVRSLPNPIAGWPVPGSDRWNPVLAIWMAQPKSAPSAAGRQR